MGRVELGDMCSGGQEPRRKYKKSAKITFRVLQGPSRRRSSGFYDVLDVQSTASQQEIKTAFRRLAQRYHPDKNVGKGVQARGAFTKKMQAINEAYTILIDDDSRKAYDAQFRLGKTKLKLSSSIRVAEYRRTLTKKEKQILNAVDYARDTVHKVDYQTVLKMLKEKSWEEKRTFYKNYNSSWDVFKRSRKEKKKDARKGPYLVQRKRC